MKTILQILFVAVIFSSNPLQGQFAPAAGFEGSTAIHKGDESFTSWASTCSLQLGWQNISDTTIGHTAVGNEISPTGKPGENGVVSLGDGGIATLTFSSPIFNGPGFDFAVFENGFSVAGTPLAFLEFAFVEVSSDGNRFVRFPTISNIQDTIQLAMEGMDASLVNNLAGKYVAGYGTPFDLEELKDSAGLDVLHITHVRVVDVVGSIDSQFATYDSQGKKINDSWPTPFPSGGFDLDAVGVIHSLNETSINDSWAIPVTLFPNPNRTETVHLIADAHWVGAALVLTNTTGSVLYSGRLDKTNKVIETAAYPKGIYFLTLQSSSETQTIKVIVE
ncbi:MAG: T9SS type A sorting domain-containing protein [Bacteroidetes bacterium]|nr:T9SS type A sorting domain-containing protein [Bacteroidota bacterium]